MKNFIIIVSLAFLINLYNAATLKLIIDHYPIKNTKYDWNLNKQ